MATTPGFFLASGWVSRAEVYSNGVQVTQMPVQTDMINGRRWIRPGDNSDILEPARLVDTPIGSRHAYGGIVWQWNMQNLSPKMTSYLQTTFFQPNGSPSNFFQREWSNKLTVQTYNRASGEWEAYQTWAKLGSFKSEASPTAGGYSDLVISFVAFRVAPDGADLTVNPSTPESIYENVAFDLSFNVENIGDSVSLPDTFWEVVIPVGTELSGFTSASDPTTVEYSTDDGNNYSTSQPSPLSLTTNIRGTLNNELQSSLSTDDYTINLVPLVTGDIDIVVAVATNSDLDSNNDAVTTTITVLPFSPIALSPQLWLDGNEGVFNASGQLASNVESVGDWIDQSGNGNSFTQDIISNQPVYNVGIRNGQSGISFNGSTHLLETDSASLPENQMTWFIAFDPSVFSAGGKALFHAGYTFFHQTPVSTLDNVGTKPRSDQTTHYTHGLATVDLQVLTFLVNEDNPISTSVYRNGSLLGTSGGDFVASPDGSIGAVLTSGTNPFQGIVLEILCYPQALSSSDRMLVEDYLIDKYAIS